MKITYLAKTEPKMSYENERVMWYKEYALAQFDDEKERCNFAGKYHIPEVLNFLNPVVSMRRRLDVLDGITSYRDWDCLTIEKDIYAAALNIGDSDYYKAKSLDRIHEQVIAYSNKYAELQKELTELNDKIAPHKHQSKSNLQEEHNDIFESNLKKNGVYTTYLGKYQAGTPRQDKIDIIRKTVRLQYDVALARIVTRIDAIQKELSEIKIQDF